MNPLELLDDLLRIAVPCLLAWNVFLFKQGQANREALHQFQLEVAQQYAGKQDLEKMLAALEERFEKQLERFIQTINREHRG